MRDVLSAYDVVDLGRLWGRRQRLTPEEMGRMYQIVVKALHPCAPPELFALGESRQELIAQFIYAKVLRLDAVVEADAEDADAGQEPRRSTPSGAYALCAYFRRYLIDCTRASSFRRKLSLGDEISDEQLDQHLGADDAADASLSEYGLTDEQVHHSARRLIDRLPEPERRLLCEGFGDEATGGLSGVAARHAIASYHYRAGRLGLVHRRQSLPADYGCTTLGRWIEAELGIPIAAENAPAILQVFKILAVQASYS